MSDVNSIVLTQVIVAEVEVDDIIKRNEQATGDVLNTAIQTNILVKQAMLTQPGLCSFIRHKYYNKKT